MTFKIQQVIQYYKQEPGDIARLLFPDNKYPMPALFRVMKGEADLTVKQLELLALYLGTTIEELFVLPELDSDEWKQVIDRYSITFKKGDYSCRLYENKPALLLKGSKAIDTLVVSPVATFNEVINQLNILINNYEHGNNQN